MTTIAYIANEFPSPLEPYVVDEVLELRRRGVEIICCSGKRTSPGVLSNVERALWEETRFFQPLTDQELLRAANRLVSNRTRLWQVLRPVIKEPKTRLPRRFRTLGHSILGAAMADQLSPLGVSHIHAHHGYFASWMALTAATLMGIGFSFTLHGSDLFQRGDLLSAKLQACRFCVTISDYNRVHILQNYPTTPAKKVIVQRLGVDRVQPRQIPIQQTNSHAPCIRILSIGRLHAVKDHRFLLQACAILRDQGVEFSCRIVGEGPERRALEALIVSLHLQAQVRLVGHVPRTELAACYRDADRVVLTSKSEEIPVVLMEAMSHEKLVLAPAITGIPELIQHQRTGFLYQPGSLPDFVSAIRWIAAHQCFLDGIRHAAAASIAASYDRQRNLTAFADQFLARISYPEDHYAHSLLQQVRLSV